VKTPDGSGGLLLATGSRKLEAVKLMVELGSDVNESRRGSGNALHTAIRFGANEIIQFLVDHGADLTVKDRFGRTPLEEAEFEAPKPTIELMRKITAEAEQRKKNAK
jgi:ankyrin repeat protein